MSQALFRVDRPVRVAILAAVAYALFIVARIEIAGHGQVGALILLSRHFVNASKLPVTVPIRSDNGYDGQFFFRMALDPFSLALTKYGITLDSFFRLERIGYPLLAWVFALGKARLVPYSLVFVNWISMVAMTFFAARLATDNGHHAVWGLVPALYPGYLFSVGRDTAEPVAAAAMIAGIYFFSHGRPWAAAVLLAFAGLARETTLAVSLSMGLVWLWRVLRVRISARQGANLGLRALFVAGGLPAVVYGLWQVVIRTHFHGTAIAFDASHNLSVPFVAMLGAIGSHVVLLTQVHQVAPLAADALWVVQLGLMLVLAGWALWALNKSSAPAYLKIALLLLVVVTVSLSNATWPNASYFRSLDLLLVFSWLVLVYGRKRWNLWIGAAALFWLAVALELVVAL